MAWDSPLVEAGGFFWEIMCSLGIYIVTSPDPAQQPILPTLRNLNFSGMAPLSVLEL